MMMMLETRFNSARLRCKLLRKNFRGATSTSLVATDNVTEKTRAIIGDARPCSNSSSISFLLLCIMKERDGRGKRFRLRNLSKWLELLLGIKTKLYFNGLEFAIRTSKSNTIKRRNSIDRSIALKEGETLKREYRYVKKEDAIIDRRKLIETRGRKGEWKGRWGRVKGRSFGCTMGGPVRALSREIPPSLPPSPPPCPLIRLALILVTDKLRRIIQELALALARPPHPAHPFRPIGDPTRPLLTCLSPRHLLDSLYPLPSSIELTRL